MNHESIGGWRPGFLPGAPIQRTAKGLAYEAYRRNIAALMADPSRHADWLAANAEIVALRGPASSQVHVATPLQNLSVMYANDAYIGEQLMPLFFTGGKLSGNYFNYPKRERLGYPDDDMSDRAMALELNSSRTTTAYALTVRALQDVVDLMTVQNQDAPLNELLDATQNVLEGLAFRREKRLATILTTGGNYSGNTTAVAAADRWDSAGGGDPLGVIDTAKAALWHGRGPVRHVGFCSLAVWNILKRHPAVIDAIKYGAGPERPALATVRAVAELLELDTILVGAAREDTANEGQTASYARIWSDVFGIVCVMAQPSLRSAAFGLTLQDKPAESFQTYDQKAGAKGAYYCKTAFADSGIVISGDAGYLITTPIG